MPDQIAVAAAHFGESLDAIAAKIRDQRHHGFVRRGIEIALGALVVTRPLAHEMVSICLMPLASATP